MPENTGKIQGSSQFKRGQSGNPKGKPKGARNKSTLAAEKLLEGSLDRICKRIEEEALNGNMQAAKMILDRVLPCRKDRVIQQGNRMKNFLYSCSHAKKFQTIFRV